MMFNRVCLWDKRLHWLPTPRPDDQQNLIASHESAVSRDLLTMVRFLWVSGFYNDAGQYFTLMPSGNILIFFYFILFFLSNGDRQFYLKMSDDVIFIVFWCFVLRGTLCKGVISVGSKTRLFFPFFRFKYNVYDLLNVASSKCEALTASSYWKHQMNINYPSLLKTLNAFV